MAIKLPENHARLSARCHIRSFPLTGSYEAVISERQRGREENGRVSLFTLPALSPPPWCTFPHRSTAAVADPFVLGCNPSAARCSTGGAGLARLLSHDGNTVGDKVEVTSAVNSQKLFTKLLAGSGARRGDANDLRSRGGSYPNVSRAILGRIISRDSSMLPSNSLDRNAWGGGDLFCRCVCARLAIDGYDALNVKIGKYENINSSFSTENVNL